MKGVAFEKKLVLAILLGDQKEFLMIKNIQLRIIFSNNLSDLEDV